MAEAVYYMMSVYFEGYFHPYTVYTKNCHPLDAFIRMCDAEEGKDAVALNGFWEISEAQYLKGKPLEPRWLTRS